MNVTISSLILTKLVSSPFLNPASRISITNISTIQSHFRNFGNSYLQKTTGTSSLLFCKTYFQNFLAPPISIIKAKLYYLTFYSTQDLSSENSVFIKNCKFSYCKTCEYGGALYIDNQDVEVSLYENEITECYSSKHGGGLHITAMSFDSRNNVYDKCYTGESCSYQTLFVDVTSNLIMDKDLIFANGDTFSSKSYCTVGLRFGNQQLNLLNFSTNQNILWGSAFSIYHDPYSSLEIDQCTFHNNSQYMSDVFYFIGVGNLCEISDCNIVYNRCSEFGTLIVALANAYVHFRNCAILRNTFGQLASSDSINVVLFELCICDFEILISESVHQIDSTFQYGEFNSVKIGEY
ncbi:hypothetical protein TRFO_25546 [Tritrichomonas foetus]|uniref:Right handed beta helix domain-containing protein n=1 Tax=Tritrichomonas foetus TaxID=1144522 RepID=A0A1J4K6C7_9EUKA|nr:hypothetical protein TRFO_25546 [Tritrichomonas foetus]|eukprot:OHT06432.1 hypothetical protein TRFO_25546 [Tritrichomonas foetus]